MQPPEIWAIDWGKKPAKRQVCRAVLRGRRYTIEPARPIGADFAFPPGSLIAFDCPFGLPSGYAERAGFQSFRDALRRLGAPPFDRFFELATTADDIALGRPFYPAKTGTYAELERIIGPRASWLRACDRATGAGPLFWTLGAKQVGQSALAVWREIVLPQAEAVSLWPFDGPLPVLLKAGRPVLAEMYPAFLLKTLGWLDPVSKRRQESRAAVGKFLVNSSLSGLDAIAVRDLLLDGFGPSPDAEDAFDATIACIALVQLLQRDAVAEPEGRARTLEGWILGL
jgi:hypothetical protein